MLADFMIRAWFAGVLLSAAAAPLGCLVVWRRLVFFGDTLAHSALLGVAFGTLSGLGTKFAVPVVVTSMAVAVFLLQRQRGLANDMILGILSHAGLAVGLVAIALAGGVQIDIVAYLFGDILAVNRGDLLHLAAGSILVLALIAAIWRPLLFATLHDEMAAAEGTRVLLLRFLFVIALANVIAAAMAVIGVLLITAMLVLPPVAARGLARTPEMMVALTFLASLISVTAGLALSYIADTPAGASIIASAFAVFVASQLRQLIADRVGKHNF